MFVEVLLVRPLLQLGRGVWGDVPDVALHHLVPILHQIDDEVACGIILLLLTAEKRLKS